MLQPERRQGNFSQTWIRANSSNDGKKPLELVRKFGALINRIISWMLYLQARTSHPAGIGTLVLPGCQRVFEPVSHLFCINPATLKVKGCCKYTGAWL